METNDIYSPEFLLGDLKTSKKGLKLLLRQLEACRYNKLTVFGWIDPDDESKNDDEVATLRELGLTDAAITSLHDNLMNAASAMHQAMDDISTCLDKLSSDIDMLSIAAKAYKEKDNDDG